MNRDKLKSILTALSWVVVFQAISAGIGYVTRQNIVGWYSGLEKSVLTPPNFVFPIVWSSLYVMIAIAGWRVFSLRDMVGGRNALIAFGVYMTLNWAWSFVFFYAHMVGLGFFWIVFTVIANLIFVALAWRVSKLVSFLMVPPILWGAFAGFLNYKIWVLN